MTARKSRKTPKVNVFVEGGSADKSKGSSALNAEVRRAFGKLAEAEGLGGSMPSFKVCGGRGGAYRDFMTELGRSGRTGSSNLLLVDSEEAVHIEAPWEHVRQRIGDGWERPDAAADADLHFMVECMEAWLVADPQALAGFYGQGFKQAALPRNPRFESIPKADLLSGLRRATADTKKGEYSKGADSFRALAKVRPSLLAEPWARRFFAELRRRCSGE